MTKKKNVYSFYIKLVLNQIRFVFNRKFIKLYTRKGKREREKKKTKIGESLLTLYCLK